MTTGSLPEPGSPSSAEQLFIEFLKQAKRGDSSDFEAACRANPTQAHELRQLKSDWDRIQDLAKRAGLLPHQRSQLADELRTRFGSDVDPAISLGGSEPDPDSGPSSELLRRLRAHAPTDSRYRILGEVGRGGMGAVLKIWDEDLRRTLAMKVVLGREDATKPGSTPPVDPNTLGRFLEEAQVTGQLDHPGIVPVHELGIGSDGRVYFTMRLVKGEDLRRIYEHVKTGHDGWNQTRALTVLLKVCEAMSYAHDKGVVHRDLKPANVMVGKFGEVYVMDWGLTRVLGQADRHDVRIRPDAPSSVSILTARREERRGEPESPLVTMDGDVLGTPGYMAPEQARGEVEKLGPHSDVYAVGAMLYHLLAGEMPFEPKGESESHAVLKQLMRGPPRRLIEIAPHVPAELVAICEHAMERDIKSRYPDMLALAQDLRAYMERRVVKAYESGTWAETKKWVQRNTPLAASLAAVFLLLVAGTSVSVHLARDASAKAELAQEQTTKFQASQKTAQDETDSVLVLWSVRKLKDLIEQANELWPAQPSNNAAFAAWLEEARKLIEGNAADPEHGIARQPGLKEHEAKLAELRKRARPLTAEQIEAEKRANDHTAELENARARLTWMRRMLSLESWPSEEQVNADLQKETLPTDAQGLLTMIAPWIDCDPSKISFGNEVKALVLAIRAKVLASDGQQEACREALKWAYFRTRKFDEIGKQLQAAQQSAAEAEAKLAAVREEFAERRLLQRADRVDAPERIAVYAQLARALDNEPHFEPPVVPVEPNIPPEKFVPYVADLDRSIAEWTGPEALAKRADEASRLAAEVMRLEELANERHTYTFDDPRSTWLHNELLQLVRDLRALKDEASGGLYSRGCSEQHGWGVIRRAEFAQAVEHSVQSSDESQQIWTKAIQAIATNPSYGKLELKPQPGLLPIGEDPVSHLWEFAHLPSGEPAQRGEDGRLILKERTGLVLVLVPGGTFLMGAQNDSAKPNYDPQIEGNELVAHEVRVSPFFISKYEMTQGQWSCIGPNPSDFGPSHYSKQWNKDGNGWTLLHPVERITWTESKDALSQLGLTLPSEAQWEYAARAGTSSPWWTGTEVATLSGAANLSDTFARSNGYRALTQWEEKLDDGNTVHASISSYRPNKFGLHDVVGNVLEWCLDGYDGSYTGGSEIPVDPVVPWQAHDNRVARGGSFYMPAKMARSAFRYVALPAERNMGLGVRPARAINP